MKLKTALLGGVAAVMLPLNAFAADLTLRFGHVGAPGSLFEASADAFAECANGKLGDRAEVQTFGASQLGKDREVLQKLKLGQVTFGLPSSVMSSVAPEFGIFEMPYIIQDREHMKRVQAEMGEVFQDAAMSEGYRIIGYFENGFRHITNNTRPINTPEDLAGIKLRTPNGAWRVKMFQQYGANPTPMSFSEVFTALQTKVIDGQENPYAQIASAKFQEVQEYLSITGHVYTPAYVLVAENQWQRLPEDVRADLETCGAETQDFVYEHAAKLETELLDVIKAAGVEVNEADKDAFIAASQPIYEAFAAEVDGGGEMIEQVQALAGGS
ncbi:TRAP transporter substrate-binding protein [Thalassococcus sp. S3]|uniref:TRAP transporter substrate-binding protein n=1 Tax=Thalassococcus sp. S3 TaxID=2017482 RepID=UPI0010242E56|nr:TRAP transporter substrate-binding protein [Thalassococcus sp. S3]QBF33638.1 C4-dicarboxylate ABC transporter [Thalassococcus sp. S3]